jgi:hypothetical protein
MNTPHPLKVEDLQPPSDIRFVLVGVAIAAAFFFGYAIGLGAKA